MAIKVVKEKDRRRENNIIKKAKPIHNRDGSVHQRSTISKNQLQFNFQK